MCSVANKKEIIMAKKKANTKMTFQFWVDSFEIKPNVAEGVKVAVSVTNTTRLTENEFKTLIDSWLATPVKGENNG